ncbi:hypothetical protein ACFQZ4_49535 [Catellatospora coxensis]
MFFDPVLSDRAAYDTARSRHAEGRKASYADVLDRCDALCPASAGFTRTVRSVMDRLDQHGIDPYYVTSIRAWVDALARGLRWVDASASPELLGYYTEETALLADLHAELPDVFPPAGIAHRRTADGMRVVPVEAVASSPRMAARVQECLPGFPQGRLPMGPADLDRVAAHIDRALDLLKSHDQDAYAILLDNLHTVFVTVHPGFRVSMGTRLDCPATAIVGLSQERLDSDDVAATAAQLFHENCHVKLALYLATERPDLSADVRFLSAFKNDLRDMETMLHTTYTIALECLVRVALTRDEPEVARPRTLAYLAALGARLKLTARGCALGITDDLPMPLRQIPGLADSACATVNALLDGLDDSARRPTTRKYTGSWPGMNSTSPSSCCAAMTSPTRTRRTRS